MKPYVSCMYCHTHEEGTEENLPTGWGVSHFKDCRSPLYYCPECAEKEDLSVKANNDAWNNPAVNKAHESKADWLAAVLPLAKHAGLTGTGGLAELESDYPDIFNGFEAGMTPAGAVLEELDNYC